MRTTLQTDFMVDQFLVDGKVQGMDHYVDNKAVDMRQSNIELFIDSKIQKVLTGNS